MFFGKQKARIRRIGNMHPIVFLPLFIAIIISISNCSATKGSIMILENPNGTGFTMDFKEWSSSNKCELSLNKGDVLQIETVHEQGEIALTISGKNGSEPYTGNNLKTGVFTVKVSETDKYVIRITGRNATGKIMVKNVGSAAK
jgi:hypothetical protein